MLNDKEVLEQLAAAFEDGATLPGIADTQFAEILTSSARVLRVTLRRNVFIRTDGFEEP